MQVIQIEFLANLAKPVARLIDQHTLTGSGHEVRISMDILRLVHPRHHFIQETSHLVVSSIGAKLGYPDGETLGEFAGGVDVVFEVLGVTGRAVPVGSIISTTERQEKIMKRLVRGQETYQWRLRKSTVHPSHVSKNFASQPNPWVSDDTAFVTPGEPRYVLLLKVESGCMCFFQPATAVGTSIHEPPASGLTSH